MRVLIIEDSELTAEVLSYQLEGQEFAVTKKYDGESGLAEALEDPPDIILLDIGLPKRDGLRVCEALREQPQTAHVPVIMMSGMAQEDDVLRGFEVGADDYVAKPFSFPELLTRMQLALNKVS